MPDRHLLAGGAPSANSVSGCRSGTMSHAGSGNLPARSAETSQPRERPSPRPDMFCPVNSPTPHKRLAVDIGGTFTDVVVEAGAQRWTRKVLTTPRAPDQPVITGTLELLAEIGVAPGEINLFIHGTTLATNAIIERKGRSPSSLPPRGFRDILDIADEGRYDQYDIFIDKPVALVPRFRRLTVPERIDAPQVPCLRPLDEAALRALLPELDRLDAASVAVAFLHSLCQRCPRAPRPRDLGRSAPGVSQSPSPARSVPRCANTERTLDGRWPTPMSSRSSPDI